MGRKLMLHTFVDLPGVAGTIEGPMADSPSGFIRADGGDYAAPPPDSDQREAREA